MTLKYKLDDVVVLGEDVECDPSYYFTPGAIVRIVDLCDEGSVDEHYTVRRVDGKGGVWLMYDNEINHNATEELQESNETAYTVGKEQATINDNAKEVRTPVLEENAPQTATQSAIDGSYSTAYNSVSVFHKSNTKECLKITIDGEALVFQQERDGEIQEVRLDFGAVGVVFSAANDLIEQYKEQK